MKNCKRIIFFKILHEYLTQIIVEITRDILLTYYRRVNHQSSSGEIQCFVRLQEIDLSESYISFFQAIATIKDRKRILFQFDRAAFSFKFLPFKVPYPVPFRLLGDEAKGWLDTTYLSPSGNLRISKGNKVNRLIFLSRSLFPFPSSHYKLIHFITRNIC